MRLARNASALDYEAAKEALMWSMIVFRIYDGSRHDSSMARGRGSPALWKVEYAISQHLVVNRLGGILILLEVMLSSQVEPYASKGAFRPQPPRLELAGVDLM